MPTAERQLNRLEREKLESRRRELLEAFNHAFAPFVIVRALDMVGLTAADLAVATGANSRTTAAWLESDSGAPKKLSHQERLRDLKELVRFIVDDGTIAFQEADWLRYPNRSADFETPLELVFKKELRRAAQVYADDVGAELPEEFLPRGERQNGRSPRDGARSRR